MAESEFDGHRLLEAARDQFVRDMEASFGERWAEFSEELCGMLFELWSRAKVGEPLPWLQEEHEQLLVDRLVRLFKDHPGLRAAAVHDTLTAGSGLLVSWSSHGQHLDLDQVNGGGIPKYATGEPVEIQQNLRERLEQLGLAPHGSLPGGYDGYLPVLLDQATGEIGGYSYGTFFVLETVHTSLETSDGIYWAFPDPKPGYSSYAHQPHVHLLVDGEPEWNEHCTWNMQTNVDGRDVISSVGPSTAVSTSTVTAVYTAIKRRP